MFLACGKTEIQISFDINRVLRTLPNIDYTYIQKLYISVVFFDTLLLLPF